MIDTTNGDRRKEVGDTASFYDQLPEVLERDYYGPDADPALAFDVSEIWRVMRGELHPKDSILEIGSGTGYWQRRITSEVGARTYGVDLSFKMTMYSSQHGSSRVVVGEASALPFRTRVRA